jgi:hypothetical protein
MVLMTIDELRERWDYLYYQLGFEELQITEQLKSGLIRKYIVKGLSLEIENNFAMCADYEENIIKNSSILMIFFLNNLTNIILKPYNGWYQEVLEFNGIGTVLIEKT